MSFIQNFKRLPVFIFLFALALSSILGLVPSKVLAASGSWVSMTTISVGGKNYIDVDPLDDNLNYKLDGGQGSCVSEVKGFDTGNIYNTNELGSATLHIKVQDPLNGSCSETTDSLTISNTQNSRIMFSWIDEDSIESLVDGKIYNRLQGQQTFAESTNSDCKSSIEVINNQSAELVYRAELLNECQETDTITGLGITNDDAADTPAGEGDPLSGGETEESTACESKGGEFSFLICPLLGAADAAFKWFDDRIIAALNVNSDYYTRLTCRNGAASCPPELQANSVEQAWSNFRNLAYILLVPIMLVMVIGTALGFNFIDAYTVKRALPRLLVAVIFIALSFDITRIMVEVTNDVGRGTAGLIASPFGGLENLEIDDIFEASVGEDVAFTGGAVVGGVIAYLSGATIWTFLITLGIALLAVIVIFALLTLREMLIIFLMILSPIAILAWIFPGNDKPWKLWWNAFSKMLIFFPLVMGLIVSGRAFASVIQQTGSDEGLVVTTLIKLIAFVGPYFFIPAAFKFAGGALGNLAGMVNNREKGIFDRARNFRGGMKKDKRERISTGNAFRNPPPGSLRRRLNTLGSNTYGIGQALKEGGITNLRRDALRAINDDNEDVEAAKFAKENAAFQAIAGDDAKLWASRATTREAIATELERHDAARFAGPQNADARNRAVEQILRAQKATSEGAFQRARLRAQASTGTGYQDANGEFNAALMLRDINETYGADRGGAGRALAEMRSALVQSGQIAGQAGYGTWAGQMENTFRNQSLQSYDDAHYTIMDDAIDSASPQYALHGKPSSARAMARAHGRRIQTIANGIAAGTHTQEDLDAASAAAAGLLDAMGQASPQNASAFANELMGVQIQNAGRQMFGPPSPGQTGLPYTSEPVTVRDLIDERMANEQYRIRRRDHASAVLSEEARMQQMGVVNPPTPPPGMPGGP